ncbi:MAG: DedA family protein [Vicinamibacterales bacterium]
MPAFLDFILHIDRHLIDFAGAYGAWVYGLLFLIVFAETGLVVTPFLPGDSLLFAAGALAATGALDPWLLGGLLAVAAIVGDAINYSAGHLVGPRVFRAETQTTVWQRLLNRDHLRRAHVFFETYGGKAVVLARFVPIVRTALPFVAGAASMSYVAFATYNVLGGVLWVALCVGAGYLFGNIPFVKAHFSWVALGIIALSLLPIGLEYVRQARSPSR